ncbi:MAG: hypothetical protein HQM08_06970 [Candidatus Riflebacteria bacterium]|nr:hypothetical protein [Candidatus Riflebacteria bacterium]
MKRNIKKTLVILVLFTIAFAFGGCHHKSSNTNTDTSSSTSTSAGTASSPVTIVDTSTGTSASTVLPSTGTASTTSTDTSNSTINITTSIDTSNGAITITTSTSVPTSVVTSTDISAGATNTSINACIITVYGTQSCPWCQKTREYLNSRGIPFVDKDVGNDSSANQEMAQKLTSHGITPTGVPVIDVCGDLVVGFNQGQLDQLLTQHGFGSTSASSSQQNSPGN